MSRKIRSWSRMKFLDAMNTSSFFKWHLSYCYSPPNSYIVSNICMVVFFEVTTLIPCIWGIQYCWNRRELPALFRRRGSPSMDTNDELFVESFLPCITRDIGDKFCALILMREYQISEIFIMSCESCRSKRSWGQFECLKASSQQSTRPISSGIMIATLKYMKIMGNGLMPPVYMVWYRDFPNGEFATTWLYISIADAY